MATLISDEKDSPMIIGRIEFLPPVATVPPVIRSISKMAIERRAEQSRRVEMVGKIMPDPVPRLATVAPCELCLEHKRFGRSTMCAACIGARAAAARQSNFLDREVTPRDFLMMCFLIGLLIFCAARFGAPKSAGTAARPAAQAQF